MTALSYTAVAGCPHRPYVVYLRRWLPKAVAEIKRPPAVVAVSLVGDTKMAALHRQFLNIDGPTDVMTFELDHDARGRCTEGEVVICPSYAKRESKTRGHDVRRELLLYALHGVLHLSGFDDRTDRDHHRMHREEDRILTAIGIGPTFRPV